LAFTSSDVEALDTAYRSGARKVTTSDGKTVEFHTVADYERLRALMMREAHRSNRKPSSSLISHRTERR